MRRRRRCTRLGYLPILRTSPATHTDGADHLPVDCDRYAAFYQCCALECDESHLSLGRCLLKRLCRSLEPGGRPRLAARYVRARGTGTVHPHEGDKVPSRIHHGDRDQQTLSARVCFGGGKSIPGCRDGNSWDLTLLGQGWARGRPKHRDKTEGKSEADAAEHKAPGKGCRKVQPVIRDATIGLFQMRNIPVADIIAFY
jgi:hypothetical protein